MASKVYLTIFSMISGLYINHQKSTTLSISDDFSIVSHIVSYLSCRPGSLSFSYLGLSLRGRVLNCQSWNHVGDNFRSRLSQWKSLHLSMGGRLTLIKSILNLIPIYALSIRILPVQVQKTLHSDD